MTSSKSRRPPRRPAETPSASLRAVAAKPRPRDLLQATSFPIHPFDKMHGVDTSGLLPARHLLTGHPNDEHVTAYYAVAPSILRALIDRWRETIPPHPISSYTFIDVGAGKGRGLLVASEYQFRRVVGIELNPQLARTARGNADHWARTRAADPTSSRMATIEVLEQDALDFRLPSKPTLIFMFHPFEAPVLEQFVEGIDRQLATHSEARLSPAPALDFIYVNAECAGVLDRHPGFEQLFLGHVKMSAEDHAADIEAIAQQKEYGSTGDEECAIYRYIGRSGAPIFKPAA
jgi:SAM-dependent methyltransferase